MALATRRIPWVRQPPGPYAVASVARDALVWTAGAPDRACVRGAWTPGTQVNPVPGVSAGKRSVLWTDGSNALTGLNFGNPLVPAVTGLTILVFAAPTAEATPRTAWSQKPGGFFVNQLSLNFNAGDGVVVGESGSITCYWRDLSAFTGNVRATGQIDGNPHSWVISNSSTAGGAIWRDGIAQTLSTNNALSGGTYFDATDSTSVGNFYNANTTNRFSYPLYLVAVWPRYLPPRVQQALSANPWRIFQPMTRRIWIGPPAGVPTLSALNFINITSTTATPRVTITI